MRFARSGQLAASSFFSERRHVLLSLRSVVALAVRPSGRRDRDRGDVPTTVRAAAIGIQTNNAIRLYLVILAANWRARARWHGRQPRGQELRV